MINDCLGQIADYKSLAA